MLTDNGTGFVSDTIRSLAKHLGIQKTVITPYHPQANGIAEAYMKVVGIQLNILIREKGHNWPEHLKLMLFAYRSTPHPATGETPFYLMHGFDPVWPADLLTLYRLEEKDLSRSSEQEITELRTVDSTISSKVLPYVEHINALQKARIMAWYKLMESHEKYAQRSGNVIKQPYGVDQLIMIKITLNELRQFSFHKLAPKWTGPHRVLKVYDNEMSYKVRNIITGVIRKIHQDETKPYNKMTGPEFVDFATTTSSTLIKV